ncbi:MAG: ABC transporter permease [Nitrososphaerota archaeon]|nr:ABC transporter permease [Nitrososphaerota archaeon]
MTELCGIYTLWLREIKRFMRDRLRVIISFIQPLLWLTVFAAGFGARIELSGNISYQQFLLPGIIGQTLLFTAMFMGISVIWDKEFGFMKEILVAPISRFSIFIGKMLGDSTAALFQGIIVFIFGFLLCGINPLTILTALPIMLLITFGLVSIGLIIASFIGSLENFGAIQTFINLPLFFLSGALFPTVGEGIPQWMQIASKLDPLSYGVDALRTVIIGPAWIPTNPLYINIAIIGIFDIIMIIIGTWAFSRMKN